TTSTTTRLSLYLTPPPPPNPPPPFPTRRSSDLSTSPKATPLSVSYCPTAPKEAPPKATARESIWILVMRASAGSPMPAQSPSARSEEHTSELQSRGHLVCRLLLEKKNVTIPAAT